MAGRATGAAVGTVCHGGAAAAAVGPRCALCLGHNAPSVRPLSGDMRGNEVDVDIARTATRPAVTGSAFAEIVVQAAALPAGPTLQNGIVTWRIVSRSSDRDGRRSRAGNADCQAARATAPAAVSGIAETDPQPPAVVLAT